MQLELSLVLIYLGKVLNHQTVVERIHLGEEKFWCRRLHTGTRVAFLIKTDREGGLLDVSETHF